MTTLEEKFHNFILSRSSNESVDDLPNSLFQKKKADYHIYDRSLILEVKNLTSDRGQILSDKLNELSREDPNFPQFFGTVPIETIIDAHENSEKFRQWCFDFAGRTVRDIIKTANTQINHTKEALEIPRSTGVLVLLNDSIPLYDDEFITAIVSKHLNQKASSVGYKREDIEAVLFINELGSSKKHVSTVIIHTPYLRNNNALTALDMLLTSWSSFNGYGVLQRKM